MIDAVDSYNEIWEREYKQSILAPAPVEALVAAPLAEGVSESKDAKEKNEDTPVIAKSVKDKVNDAILQFKKGACRS